MREILKGIISLVLIIIGIAIIFAVTFYISLFTVPYFIWP